MANSMDWEDLKAMMLEEYYPRWSLTVKDFNIESYIARFNDLEI